MSSSFFLFFFLSIFFFLQSVNSVDYLGDQGSQLINQFLLNPESSFFKTIFPYLLSIIITQNNF